MSNWLVLLIGLIAGLFIGITAGRKNYESCREQLDRMKDEIKDRKEKLAQTQKEIKVEERHLDEISAEVDSAQKMIEASGRDDESGTTRTDTLADLDLPDTATTLDSPTENAGQAMSSASKEETLDIATRAEGVDVTISETECPQKLARIKGIGRVYEDKLYQAGIGTYWQVATMDVKQLADILGIQDFQAVDLQAIKQGAKELAEKTNTVGKIWNGHQPDDLENLPGIGKTYEGRLYDAGVCTWAKLAALTPEELAAILKAPAWNQPDYSAWINYARQQVS